MKESVGERGEEDEQKSKKTTNGVAEEDPVQGLRDVFFFTLQCTMEDRAGQ